MSEEQEKLSIGRSSWDRLGEPNVPKVKKPEIPQMPHGKLIREGTDPRKQDRFGNKLVNEYGWKNGFEKLKAYCKVYALFMVSGVVFVIWILMIIVSLP